MSTNIKPFSVLQPLGTSKAVIKKYIKKTVIFKVKNFPHSGCLNQIIQHTISLVFFQYTTTFLLFIDQCLKKKH